MALPKEHRTAPYLPFSPPQQQAGLSISTPPRGPRPSVAASEFMPSPPRFDRFDMDFSTTNAEAGPSRARTRHGVDIEEEDDVLEEDEFQLAKSYFDIHELDRVVHTLKNARGARSRFLKFYASYLVRGTNSRSVRAVC